MLEHHDSEERLSIRLPVRPESVSVGRRAAVQFAEETDCSGPTLWRVRLAVSEALSNVVLHAHEPADAFGAHLVLCAQARRDEVVITVADAGAGLGVRQDSPGLGLGLALIAKSCDQLEVDTGAVGGTVVRMTFKR